MTPLVLLTGFLGSGKTTLLRAILPLLRERGVEPHVILNDYQNAEVDAASLAGLVEEIQPISGSCVCCGSKEELLEAVAAVPEAERAVLLIEANGTTDTPELIEILTLDRRTERFTLPLQVGLVDASRWQKRFWHNGLEAEQVRTATHLQVTRWEGLCEKRRAKVEESLAQTNAVASRINAATLADELKALAAEVSPLPPRAHGRAGCEPSSSGHSSHSHSHSHHAHQAGHHHFASLELSVKSPVDEIALTRFVQELPDEVLRVKGMVRFSDSPKQPQILQRVEGEKQVDCYPIDFEPAIEPTLVLIGQGLDEEAIRRAGEAVLKKSE
ncbi:MAG: GTP-binding protein [Verrucomicrobiota bacterium]